MCVQRRFMRRMDKKYGKRSLTGHLMELSASENELVRANALNARRLLADESLSERAFLQSLQNILEVIAEE